MNQIQAVSGHKTLAEVERYTRDADRTRLAEEVISHARIVFTHRRERHDVSNI